ncbi:MAG: YdeI/OmpD-associated family protein, partial [Phycisphaerales bacterium]
ADEVCFTATLPKPRTPQTPAHPGDSAWTLLLVPRAASAKLPSRGMVSVVGTIQGSPLRTTLHPDGKGGHWLKVDHALRTTAGFNPGDVVSVQISTLPPGDEPEPDVPPDLKRALAGAPGEPGDKARATWNDITPAARRDFIFWISSPKKTETRIKRIATACDMLAKGKRRPCCFDRSGMYSSSLSCPVADEAP